MNLCKCLLLVSICLSIVQAADSGSSVTTESVPKGPLLRRIPDFSAWRISYFYSQDKARQEKTTPVADDSINYDAGPDPDFLPFVPRRVSITRTKTYFLAVIEDVKGNSIEQFFDGVNEFVTGSRFQGVTYVSREPTVPFFLPDFRNVDFPDMEWISSETFKGVQAVSDNRCMFFEKDGMQVWINLESRLPVLWKRGGETRTFQQLPAPTVMMQIPPKMREVREEMERSAKRLLKPCPRGS